MKPFSSAEVLAAKDDWPKLYDVPALNANEVPVACASYFEDMFVDFDLAKETAENIEGSRVWWGERRSRRARTTS